MANMQVGNTALMGFAFNIRNYVPDKFSGHINKFTEFLCRLRLADTAMASLGMDETTRFLNLLKVLEGPPLQYVKDLSLSSTESYSRAILTLREIYLRSDAETRNTLISFFKMPRCNSSFTSRQQLHSAITSFFNCIMSKNFTGEQIWMAMSITHIEQCMDEGLLREYTKRCAAKPDPNMPLGYTVDVKSFLETLYQIMVTDLKLSQASSTSTNQFNPHQKGRFRAGVHADD